MTTPRNREELRKWLKRIKTPGEVTGMFWVGDEASRAILAALDAAGLAIVPKELTKEMLTALNAMACCEGYVPEGYRDMLAASPYNGCADD